MRRISVEWVDGGREPKSRANPNYPNGIVVDMTNGQRAGCWADLPYPAQRCGYYLLTCSACGCRTVVTTAGRTDDPRKVKIPCRTT